MVVDSCSSRHNFYDAISCEHSNDYLCTRRLSSIHSRWPPLHSFTALQCTVRPSSTCIPLAITSYTTRNIISLLSLCFVCFLLRPLHRRHFSKWKHCGKRDTISTLPPVPAANSMAARSANFCMEHCTKHNYFTTTSSSSP